jgi:hypothetical protein
MSSQLRPETLQVGALTRNDVAGIHRVLILDESEAVHQLDLSDLAGSMGLEVSLYVGLGGCGQVSQQSTRFPW